MLVPMSSNVIKRLTDYRTSCILCIAFQIQKYKRVTATPKVKPSTRMTQFRHKLSASVVGEYLTASRSWALTKSRLFNLGQSHFQVVCRAL